MSYWTDTIRRIPGRQARIGTRSTRSWPRLLADGVLLWMERKAQRRQLAQLDPRMLKDIGISRETALEEARKPGWRP